MHVHCLYSILMQCTAPLAPAVVAGSAVVMALQPLVSRETSPTSSAVITVSRFNTGEGATNVIPPSVTLQASRAAWHDSDGCPSDTPPLRYCVPHLLRARSAR